MKGLFLNGFYAAVGSVKLFLLLVAAAGAALLVFGGSTAQELFVYLSVTALSVNGVAGMHNASSWNKFAITLPVRRRDVVRCQFLNHLFWVLVGTVIALLVTAAAARLHGNGSTVSMFVLGIGISLLTAAIFYPAAHLLGTERSEAVLVLSVLGAVGLSVGCVGFLNRFPALSSPRRTALFIAFYLLTLLASYRITVGVHARKEY